MIRTILALILALTLFADTPRAQLRLDSARGVLMLDTTASSSPAVRTNFASLGFDHILSIYEWRSATRFASISAVPIGGSRSLNDIQTDSVDITGQSRFLEQNSITSTEATAFVTADQPLGAGSVVKPFLMCFGTSYVTSSVPGTGSLVTRQENGFGIAGVRSRLPGSDVDVSLGGGIARQSQPASSTYGAMVRADLKAPMESITDNTAIQATALGDERFFRDRGQRYSNDLVSLRSISAFGQSDTVRYTNRQSFVLTPNTNTNVAQLNLALGRRDYFFSPDSGTSTTGQSVKQDRTEYSLLLLDSLVYPRADDHFGGDASLELEPRSVVRHSDAPSGELAAASLSGLSSLLAPSDVSSLRLALGGRIGYEWNPTLPTLGADARVRFEEKTENVRLLSDEITSPDPSLFTKLASTLDQASYATRSTAAGLSMHYAPSIRDLVRVEGNARLLNYDTPSDLNDDDHDELVTSTSLRYDRAFSEELVGKLEVTGSRTHLVYLKSDRSAQNNVTNSVALATEAMYTASGVLAHVRGEVSANYTLLDYLDSLPSLQAVGNYLIRGVTVMDSLVVPLGVHPFGVTEPLTIEEGATVGVSERGGYNQSAFTERRDTRVTQLGVTALLGLSNASGGAPWSIRAGVRGFILSQSGRGSAGVSTTSPFYELQRQTRVGPMVLVSFQRASGVGPVLAGSLWYATIKTETFDVPLTTRTPQLESHLQVQWTF